MGYWTIRWGWADTAHATELQPGFCSVVRIERSGRGMRRYGALYRISGETSSSAELTSGGDKSDRLLGRFLAQLIDPLGQGLLVGRDLHQFGDIVNGFRRVTGTVLELC